MMSDSTEGTILPILLRTQLGSNLVSPVSGVPTELLVSCLLLQVLKPLTSASFSLRQLAVSSKLKRW
jgi:hypothetical protein